MAEEGETPGPDAVTVMSYVPGATEPPTSIVTVTVVVAPLVTILLTVPVTPVGIPVTAKVTDPLKPPPAVPVPVVVSDPPCTIVPLVGPREMVSVGLSVSVGVLPPQRPKDMSL